MLSLGDINFGLGVDTSSLGESVRRVQQFGHQVEAAARSSAQGARQVEIALRKQEAATLGALQSVMRFNQEARRMHVPASMINQSANAFATLSTRMTQGALTGLQYQRAMEDFQARMGKVRRELATFDPAPNGSKFKVILQDLTSSATLALGPLSGVGARITALSGIMGRSSLIATTFFTAIAAGGYAFYKMERAAIDTEMALERVRSRLGGLSRTNQEAQADFDKIRAIADQTGNSFTILAEQYTNLKAASKNTSLEGEKTFEVFQNIAVAAAKFRLNGVQVEATFKALSQMMSKGTVQLEELKGQLGDQLPIAMQAAAKAMGVTTKELNVLIRQGKVSTEEFLVPFSKAVADLLGVDPSQRVDTLQASLGRLGNAMTFFNDEANRTFGFTQLFKQGVDLATQSVVWASNNIEMLTEYSKYAGVALVAVVAPNIVSGFLSLARGIALAGASLVGLGSAANALPFVRLITVIAAAAAAFYSMNDATAAVSRAMNEPLRQSVEQYIALQETMKTQSSSTTKQLIGDVESQIRTIQMQINALLTARQALAQYDAASDKSASKVMSDIGQGAARFLDALMLTADPSLKNSTSKGLEATLFPSKEEELKAKTDELWQLQNALDNYQQQLTELSKIAQKPDIATLFKPGGGDSGEGLDRTAKAVRDAKQAILELQQVAAAGSQGSDMFRFLEKQADANKKVADFRDRLSDAKVPLGEVNALTAQYAASLQAANNAVLAMDMEPFQKQIGDVQRQLEAASMGPQVYKSFQKQEETNSKIRQFRDALVSAGLPLQTINDLSLQYAQTLQLLNTTLEGPLAAMTEMFNTFENETVTAFRSMTDAFSEMVVNSKFDADSMVNIAKSMVAKIVSELMTLSIVNPLLNSIFSPATPYPSFFGKGNSGGGVAGIFGSLLGGLFGGGLNAAGGAWNSGGARFMAQGGLLRGATAFQTRDGVAIGGEADTEAVMPLARTRNGDLGVRVTGNNASGSQVTIIDQRKNAPPIERQQDSSGNLRFFIKDEVNSIIGSGQADSSLGGRFGVKANRRRR
jgi:tape measure domain-containing protein